LVSEVGYDAASVDAIAARARTGKEAIYRLWGSKALLVADAVRTGALPLPDVPLGNSGDILSDLTTWLVESVPLLSEEASLSVTRALLAEQASMAGTDGAPRDPFTTASTVAILRRIDDAKARGEVGSDVESAAVADLIIGALTVALLGAAPLTEERARAWARVVVRGVLST
jgi:AcrR family transcriptional regulator